MNSVLLTVAPSAVIPRYVWLLLLVMVVSSGCVTDDGRIFRVQNECAQSVEVWFLRDEPDGSFTESRPPDWAVQDLKPGVETSWSIDFESAVLIVVPGTEFRKEFHPTDEDLAKRIVVVVENEGCG